MPVVVALLTKGNNLYQFRWGRCACSLRGKFEGSCGFSCLAMQKADNESLIFKMFESLTVVGSPEVLLSIMPILVPYKAYVYLMAHTLLSAFELIISY